MLLILFRCVRCHGVDVVLMCLFSMSVHCFYMCVLRGVLRMFSIMNAWYFQWCACVSVNCVFSVPIHSLFFFDVSLVLTWYSWCLDTCLARSRRCMFTMCWWLFFILGVACSHCVDDCSLSRRAFPIVISNLCCCLSGAIVMRASVMSLLILAFA